MSLGCAKYFVAALDAYSELLLVQFVHKKSKAGDSVIEMIRQIENLFHSKTGTVISMSHKSLKWV